MSWFKINQSQIIDRQLRQANHPRSIKITELTTEKKKLPSKYPRPLGRLIALGGKYIDLKMGLIGAVVMAVIVFIINYLVSLIRLNKCAVNFSKMVTILDWDPWWGDSSIFP